MSSQAESPAIVAQPKRRTIIHTLKRMAEVPPHLRVKRVVEIDRGKVHCECERIG